MTLNDHNGNIFDSSRNSEDEGRRRRSSSFSFLSFFKKKHYNNNYNNSNNNGGGGGGGGGSSNLSKSLGNVKKSHHLDQAHHQRPNSLDHSKFASNQNHRHQNHQNHHNNRNSDHFRGGLHGTNENNSNHSNCSENGENDEKKIEKRSSVNRSEQKQQNSGGGSGGETLVLSSNFPNVLNHDDSGSRNSTTKKSGASGSIRYRIVKLIASGGFSRVYEVECYFDGCQSVNNGSGGDSDGSAKLTQRLALKELYLTPSSSSPLVDNGSDEKAKILSVVNDDYVENKEKKLTVAAAAVTTTATAATMTKSEQTTATATTSVQSTLIERVREEIRVFRHLSQHENVVGYVDSFIDEQRGRVYIFQELCDLNLKMCLERQMDRITDQLMLHWCRTISNVLLHIHDNGYVHRDIKPANILLKREVDPVDSSKKVLSLKVCDFGLSKYVVQSAAKTNVGSTCYIAPEVSSHSVIIRDNNNHKGGHNVQSNNNHHHGLVMNGREGTDPMLCDPVAAVDRSSSSAMAMMNTRKKYTNKCDIWSFGVLIYQLIGRIRDEVDLPNFARLLKEKPHIVEKSRHLKQALDNGDHILHELALVCVKCLKLNPYDRPTAREIKEQIS